MIHRGWFRLRSFSIALILSCPPAFSGDGGATVSLVKTVGKWALTQVAKVGTAVVAGHAAQQYNSNNFDVDTGTFGIPGGIPSSVTETRGVPVGLQSSTSYETPSEAKAQRDYDRLPREQQTAHANKQWEDKSKDFTQRELDYWIKTEDSLIKSAKDEAAYRKRKGQADQAAHNEARAKEYEATKGILEKEKAAREPRGKIIRQLSDGSLKKLLRNSKEELAFTQQELKTLGQHWFPDEQKVANNQQIEKNLQVTINQIEREQQSRSKAKTIHTVSTAMVLTSKTAGTDNKSKVEKAPEGGNGGGGNGGKEPEKDPKKGPGVVTNTAGVYGAKKAKEYVQGHSEPHPTPSHGESHSTTTTTTTQTKHDKSIAEHKAHEAQQFEANTKAMKDARKAERAQQNFDTQPFHEKGIEPHFPQDPGQRIHQIDDRTGHFKEFTPGVEEAVRSTIKKEHFDYVENGNSRYTQEVKGVQVWVEVRPDGTIKNFGGNEVFHTKNPVTGKWERPPNLPKKGPGTILGAAVATGLATGDTNANTSESNGGDFKLSPNTLKALGVDVQTKIKNDPNPFTLPPAPESHKPMTFTTSPEMQAIVNKRVENLRSMSPQDQLKEVMKPIGTPTLSIPGTTTYKPTSPTMPSLTLPSSTTKSSGTGQTALPVLTSTKTSTPSAPPKLTFSNPKPASLPSAPKSSSSTYSAPRPSAPVSRPTPPPSGYGSRGGGPPSSFGGGFKRN